eukprot:TRINITY_DN32563_c0_g1_i1.p1 TRINITY_DN32563_c0_g1~~TRINITY_DN32563_c0_g1_i1.p1  ORF type:complete len:346 (+),score=37.46 TRINITY_DN32563_c0_g1_i1:45-1082(+)
MAKTAYARCVHTETEIGVDMDLREGEQMPQNLTGKKKRRTSSWDLCADFAQRSGNVGSNALFLVRLFFGRRRSRWFGTLSRVYLPVTCRSALFRAYAFVFNADLSELKDPLDSFQTLSDFFCRELRDGARPIAAVPAGIVSPADARILTLGVVHSSGARVEQVKGATYSVRALLGRDPTANVKAGHIVQYAVLYLSPGDYHCVHSPCDITFTHGRHFSGEFFPLKSLLLETMNDLFCINERVVLTGTWKYGLLHMVSVAAANVGDIFLDFDPKLKTNRGEPLFSRGRVFEKLYPSGVAVDCGSKIGGFRLGSTVVLVLETPEFFQWKVAPGDKIKVGQPLGECTQ